MDASCRPVQFVVLFCHGTSYDLHRLRSRLKHYCDEVAESGERLIIQRRSGAAVALVSLDELNGLEETAHLLRSPKNAQRLYESIDELQSGGGVVMTADELEKKFGLNE